MTATTVVETSAVPGGDGASGVIAVAEMNLEEYPAFRLGRRSRRPELRYTRTRTGAGGQTVEQVWIVRGAEGLGLPGPFEQDLYVALLVLFTEQGLPPDGRIRFTRNRLAQVMGCSNSGRGYELLEQGLSRLAGAAIHAEHAFYRPAALGPNGVRSGPVERLSVDFHILEEVRVYERAGTAPNGEEGSGQVVERPRVEHGRPFELSVARLGLPLVESYERRYTKALDASFYFSLSRPLSKRLYRYLDKVRNGRSSFEIGVRALADVLGLEYRYPSDIKDALVEAHAELLAGGYLAGAEYAPLAGGPGAGEKAVYAFDPAFDRRPRRRAGGTRGRVVPAPVVMAASHSLAEVGHSPAGESGAGDGSAAPAAAGTSAPAGGKKAGEGASLRAELEAFGITPARAASLVEAYPAEHIAARIAYVRGLVSRRRPGAPGLRNPAGFLARAIEQSYAIPQLETKAALPVVTSTAEKAPVPALEAVIGPAAPGAGPGDTTAPQAKARGECEAAEEQDEAAVPSGAAERLWVPLAAALKERLSAATYAAWVASVRPEVRTDGGQEGEGATESAERLVLVVPSAFALDRWRRPPIAPALEEAAGALGLAIAVELADAAHG